MKFRGYALWILLGVVIAAIFLIGQGRRDRTPPHRLAAESSPLGPGLLKTKQGSVSKPLNRKPQPCRVPKNRQNLTEEAWKVLEDLADPCG